jgi:putative transport protein
LEHIRGTAAPGEVEQRLAEAVVGYSVAYPMGVVGVIAALALAQRVWRVDFRREAESQREVPDLTRPLQNRTLRVENAEAAGATVGELIRRHGWDVVFGRRRHAGALELVQGQTRLAPGDLVTVVGTEAELDKVQAGLGPVSEEKLELDRSELDYRRIFVSNPRLAGHRLRDLNLPQQYGAVITRIRRGDVELLPHGDVVLELGDRVRVLTHRQHMPAVTAFFGDSYRALSEIDVLTFSLGLALGLLVGTVPLPLPGGVTLRLGLAGGPLLVALALGAMGRTGPLVWSLPYSANLTLRQVGLILFLAGVGTRSGYDFAATFQQGGGLALFAAGAGLTFGVAALTLWVGYKVLRIPLGLLAGILAGLQTQPAALGFALEQTQNDLPNLGYASVYPLATIAKIVLAQVILSALGA